MSQIQEQNKFPKTAPNETEIKYLPHREFKVTVMKKLSAIQENLEGKPRKEVQSAHE